jgi:DNA-binding NtrC family response regulator
MSAPNIEILPAAMKALQEYAWPGNVRELKNVIERGILISDRRSINSRDLRFDAEEAAAGAALPADMTLEQVERWYVERVLREENGKVDSASRRLGIPRSTLYQKLKKWELTVSRS